MKKLSLLFNLNFFINFSIIIQFFKLNFHRFLKIIFQSYLQILKIIYLKLVLLNFIINFFLMIKNY